MALGRASVRGTLLVMHPGLLLATVTLLVGGACSKEPRGDWEASRDAYCRKLDELRPRVSSTLDRLVEKFAGLEKSIERVHGLSADPAAHVVRSRYRLEQCERLRGELQYSVGTLDGFVLGASALFHGRPTDSPVESGLPGLVFEWEPLSSYDLGRCRNGDDAGAADDLRQAEQEALAKLDKGLADCRSAGWRP